MSMLFRMNQPLELVRKIVYTLPEELFISSTTTFLDPCMGKGDYLVMVAHRLREYGHSKKNILNRLYGIECNELYVQNCLQKTPLDGAHIYIMTYEEVLKWEPEMKFDCVISNPPFQRSVSENRKSNLGKSLWTDFLIFGIDITKDNGYLAFITPTGWMSPASKALPVFQQNSIIWIDVNTASNYFNVGSKFSHYILQKKKKDKKMVTLLTGTYSNKFVSGKRILPTMPYFPNILTNDSIGILSKTSFADNKKLVVEASYQLHSDKKHLLSKTKTKKYKYETFHTNAQTWFASIKHKMFDVNKVVFSRSGNIKPRFNNKCGVTEAGFYIEVKNKTQGDRLTQVLESKLYSFITQVSKWSGFNVQPVLVMLPAVDLTRSWTDEQLYKHFKLTKKEIQLIEDTIK